MATLLVPEQHGSISAALNAASNGDTISIASGTYTEQITTGTLSNVIITSRGTDPTAVVIQHNGVVAGSTVYIGGGCTLTNLTVIYTGAGAYVSNGAAADGLTGTATLFNCHLYSERNGVLRFNAGSIIERCLVECTSANQAIGVYAGSAQLLIGSSIVRNFNNHLIYCPGSIVVNTLAVTNQLNVGNSHRFIYALQHYNNVCRNQDPTKAGHSGIAANGGATTFSKNSTCWGSFVTEFSGLTTVTNSITDAQVVADGNDLFVDDANYDFHINNAGLNYQSGDPAFQNTHASFLEDLDGVTYDLANMSRGPYEYVSAGGAKKRNVRLSLLRLKLKL